jgi:hypothetical protein
MRSIVILRSRSAVFIRPDPGRRREPEAAPANPHRQSLAPLAPPPRTDCRGCAPRPSAAFLAHLIATAQQAPQTRHRCRAEAAEACAHYASGASEKAIAPPSLVCLM